MPGTQVDQAQQAVLDSELPRRPDFEPSSQAGMLDDAEVLLPGDDFTFFRNNEDPGRLDGRIYAQATIGPGQQIIGQVRDLLAEPPQASVVKWWREFVKALAGGVSGPVSCANGRKTSSAASDVDADEPGKMACPAQPGGVGLFQEALPGEHVAPVRPRVKRRPIAGKGIGGMLIRVCSAQGAGDHVSKAAELAMEWHRASNLLLEQERKGLSAPKRGRRTYL